MDQKAIGHRIKLAREQCGLTQEELAEILDMSPMHISVLERGAKPPKLETLVNIANALRVSADTLLQDVVDCSSESFHAQSVAELMELPYEERTRIINAIKAFMGK